MFLIIQEQKYLLELARRAIGFYLDSKTILKMEPPRGFPRLLKTKASFVTLKINENLRGCIGHIAAFQPLYKDVIDNSVNAAFDDPRFRPLSFSELNLTKISISVLSEPKEFKLKDKDELIEKLEKEKPGVILSCGFRRATYLPEVWKEIGKAEEFMDSLSLKAGLIAGDWRNFQKVKIFLYTAECFTEKV